MSEKITTFIYGLKDPNTNKIRYVGKSDNPKDRYKQHISDTTNSYKVNWINQLKQAGTLPVLVILEEVPYSQWEYKERSWIAKGLQEGWGLTNIQMGGISNDYRASELEYIKLKINRELTFYEKMMYPAMPMEMFEIFMNLSEEKQKDFFVELAHSDIVKANADSLVEAAARRLENLIPRMAQNLYRLMYDQLTA